MILGYLAQVKILQTDVYFPLILQSSFYKRWIAEGDNKLKLQNLLSHYIDSDTKFNIDFAVVSDNMLDTEKRDKLARRYNDLTD
jgi:hypothetical protein